MTRKSDETPINQPTTWITERLMRLQSEVDAYTKATSGLDAEGLIKACLKDYFKGRIAVVSSFGAESVLMLYFVARINVDTPVFFIDTLRTFAETLSYRDEVVHHLGLTNIHTLTPSTVQVAADDPYKKLYSEKPDLCCHVRKKLPLLRALRPYKAWISGQKAFQSETRKDVRAFSIQDELIKISPLYNWSGKDIQTKIKALGLPEHPLVARGYPSIGCAPCTSRVNAGEDVRAGRWRGQEKTECGIHFSESGVIRKDKPFNKAD